MTAEATAEKKLTGDPEVDWFRNTYLGGRSRSFHAAI